MLLDNLIDHLTALKEITGGKIHVSVSIEINGTIHHTNDLSVLKTEDQINIRNFN